MSPALAQWRQANADASCYCITPKLISGCKLTEEECRLVKDLESSFEAASELGPNIVLYRVTHGKFISMISENIYPSFLSTSMCVGEALKFAKDHEPDAILLKIYFKQDQKALKVSDPNLSTPEMHEYLLPRNLRWEAEQATISDFPEETDLLLQVGNGSISGFYSVSIVN
jgi:hypothetical protein